MLESCSGTPIDTVRTDVDGYYYFDALQAGDYRVRFTAPPGFVFSPEGSGDDFRFDSDPNPDTGTIRCKTLASNQKRRGIDAGFIPQP